MAFKDSVEDAGASSKGFCQNVDAVAHAAKHYVGCFLSWHEGYSETHGNLKHCYRQLLNLNF